MRRTFVERLRVTAPSGEHRKLGKGGSTNGPCVRALATCAEISAERESVVDGDSKAVLRFVQDWEEDLLPEKPRFAPCRMI